MSEKTETSLIAGKGFTAGEHVVLRPPVENDLQALADLLAENPCDESPTPWTHQRLKKKFEDKEEPGLWGRSERYFTVARRTGEVVGFLLERMDDNRGMYWNGFHIAEALEDRDALGPDALKAYMDYKLKWHNPLRISFDVIEPEVQKASWLEQQDYHCEIRLERRMLYRGRPVDQCIYSWLSEQLLNAPGDPHRVAGEE